MSIPQFLICTCSKEIIDIFLHLKKTFNFGFFSDTIKARALKLFMIKTLGSTLSFWI